MGGYSWFSREHVSAAVFGYSSQPPCSSVVSKYAFGRRVQFKALSLPLLLASHFLKASCTLPTNVEPDVRGVLVWTIFLKGPGPERRTVPAVNSWQGIWPLSRPSLRSSDSHEPWLWDQTNARELDTLVRGGGLVAGVGNPLPLELIFHTLNGVDSLSTPQTEVSLVVSRVKPTKGFVCPHNDTQMLRLCFPLARRCLSSCPT